MQAEITDAEIKQLLFFMKDDKSPNLVALQLYSLSEPSLSLIILVQEEVLAAVHSFFRSGKMFRGS